jgi:hypothetical protein
MSRPEFRRRLAAISVAVTAAVLIGPGVPTPAGATTSVSPPSMTVDHGWVNIAVQGSVNSLLPYWAIDGTTIWHKGISGGVGLPLP